MQNLIFISMFGLVGVWSRYGVDSALGKPLGEFPTSTLIVNLLGSILAGIIYALSERESFSPALQIGLLVGFCGGFTTFSAYTLQTLVMLERGKVVPALTYLILSPALGLMVAFVSVLLIRKFAPI